MMSATVRLSAAATLLALTVIIFGAFVRLSDAGLSCPDWPGCYGSAIVPSAEQDLAAARAAFPQRPVEAGKAWKEMLHRYLAGLLGLCIVGLAIIAWRDRTCHRVLIPSALVLLVGLQVILGMWTVTLLLKPVIVTAHLLGGLTTAALLWWLYLDASRVTGRTGPYALRPGARGALILGICLLYVQLMLGGWTSANYAALACPDFPTCHGEWWPEMHFAEAFEPWRDLGRGGDGRPLSLQALVAIQTAHRAGALVVLCFVGGLSVAGLRARGAPFLRFSAVITLGLLGAQVALGVANVLMARPLAFAVAHNAVAALLLLALVTQLACMSHQDHRGRT